MPVDMQWLLPICKTLCILSSNLSTISLHSGLSNVMETGPDIALGRAFCLPAPHRCRWEAPPG